MAAGGNRLAQAEMRRGEKGISREGAKVANKRRLTADYADYTDGERKIFAVTRKGPWTQGEEDLGNFGVDGDVGASLSLALSLKKGEGIGGVNHGLRGLQVCGLASLKRNFLPFFFRFFKAYYRLDGG